jgi:hypothetical protein
MISDRQREIVKRVWPIEMPLPTDDQIEMARQRWIKEAETDTDNSDLYFDFSLLLQTYTPLMWMRLFDLTDEVHRVQS